MHVDKVEWLYIPDQTTQINALNNAEIDFLEGPSLDLPPLISDNPDITVAPLPQKFSGG
ncbi:MAG: hypothetical protein Ct9H300mP16_02470 [Pseudomonadota bacterium]|nr:MAG: hypothetical protein Ct9H300mP16_02470 [Pseudomonadota bacterium]